MTILSCVFWLGACSTSPERSSKVAAATVILPLETVEASKKDSESTAITQIDTPSVTTPKQEKPTKPMAKPQISKPAISKKNLRPKEQAAKKSIVKPSIETKTSISQESERIVRLEYTVDLTKLPLQIGRNWTLKREAIADDRCALVYKNTVMEDGQGETPVLVIVMEDKVLLKTKSNIDVSYTRTGFTIDDLPQRPIEKLYNDYSISFETQYHALIEDMKSGRDAVLTLGFWPSWPITHTYSVTLNLEGFSAAQQALTTCLALEKQLK